MDPISAAASIVGLLGAAAKVSEVLLKFIGGVKGASTFIVPDINRDDDTVRAANDFKKKVQSESSETVKENAQDAGKESTDYQGPAFSFTFDQDLKNSRPYARATKRNSTWSTASSAIHTVGWSCLSGLSLADISEISVIGLPISPQELWNGHHYILTDYERDSIHIKAQAPVMDRLAHKQEDSLSETESEPIETRKGVSFGNSAQSFGRSLGSGPVDQRSRRVPTTADGTLLEPKKIILLGMTPVSLRWTLI